MLAVLLATMSVSAVAQPVARNTSRQGLPAERGPAPFLRPIAFHENWRAVLRRFAGLADRDLVVVDAARERLTLLRGGRILASWPVSTAVAGLGERSGSFETPTGWFRIVAKRGAGLPEFEILNNGETPSGRMARPVFRTGDLRASQPIVGRVLELEGLEPGWNEGGDVDTLRRQIYIHGTPNLGMLGRRASLGCVQMAPAAVVRLFNLVPIGTPVLITARPNVPEKIAALRRVS